MDTGLGSLDSLTVNEANKSRSAAADRQTQESDVLPLWQDARLQAEARALRKDTHTAANFVDLTANRHSSVFGHTYGVLLDQVRE